MRILLIGESCTDEYVYGTCKRICPEAAAICFKSSGQTKQSGGMTANVLANIRSLCPTLEVEVITNLSTITKRRFVDLRYNTIVFREDHSDFCDRVVFDDISFKEYDAIVISDYCKGFLTEEDIRYISSQGRSEAPQFIDTKKRLGRFLNGIDFVKINEEEYNRNVSNLEDILGSCKNLIVTCGRKGATHHSRGNPPVRYKSDTVDVRDVCGAGDTFLAALVVDYLSNRSIESGIKYANHMASRVVRKLGVATP
jgi:bifunctional ADP-heptose synthase (sugar kinase/adenylyltransferase)